VCFRERKQEVPFIRILAFHGMIWPRLDSGHAFHPCGRDHLGGSRGASPDE
jgi:hypothetical protein